MKKFYLVFGSIAILALGSAAACSSDGTGTGGSGGGGTGGSGTGTATGTGGSGTGTATGTGGGGTGGGGTGGGATCIGCGDYVAAMGAEDVDALCGFVSSDPNTGTFECEVDTSCDLLIDLQTCTCDDVAGCDADCGDNACVGDAASNDCLACITNTCASEFNACTGDVQ